MMPMKNYTTKVSAARSIEAIQTALVKHGATGILYEYEPGSGRAKGSLKPWNWAQAYEIGCCYPVGAHREGQIPPDQRLGGCPRINVCSLLSASERLTPYV